MNNSLFHKFACLFLSCLIGSLSTYRLDKSFMGDLVTNTECKFCNTFMPIARSMVIKGRTQNFRSLAVQACLSFKISTDRQVCDQTVSVFDDVIYEALKSSPLTNEELCSVFLKCKPVKNPIWNWNIKLPSVEKPKVVSSVLPDVNS
jgi:hypothetical protein